MSIQIRSINQIIGDMVRKIIADTALNDINTGSILLTILEAAASNDFENNAAILNVLELLNIDALKNNDLDSRASDYGLFRRAAIKASGQVTIYNSNIIKRSTGLYVIKPAPIAGQTTLFVNNTTGWAPSGSLYIGRGTDSFEGPINYSSITVYPTYSQINLSSALQKDHLISDSVIDSQGEPDRLISAGTVVKIEANNQNPEVQYVTLRDATIPAGEDKVEGVSVIAVVAGSQGNAGINTITAFDSSPFDGATVLNTSAFSNGRDIETDTDLRNRIKSYAITLARGTAASIIAAVNGVSDPDDNKQVSSAIMTEPVKAGNPSILYIDDGSGFQPSYTGQSVDSMLSNATGREEFLQLSNYPIPRPQVVNVESGPFNINDGSFLRVIVDGKEETVYFDSTQFLNISAATLAEVVIAINASSTTFKARFTNNGSNILLYPVEHDVETIQVAEIRADDEESLYINTLLKFPTNEFSYISLYKNNTRLHEKAKSASLETVAFASWNITGSGNIIIAVDGTPSQDRNFVLSDFENATSFTSITLEQWVEVFNKKFAGIIAEATPSQTMKITSNQIGSKSGIEITGGDYMNKWFPNIAVKATGQNSEFELNRQTGNLRIFDINPGDNITAGIDDAKGFVLSTQTITGNYNVANDAVGRPSEMVIVSDSSYCVQRSIALLIGASLNVSVSGSTMRITSSTIDAFAKLLPGDFLYIVSRTSGWFNNANTGLYKIIAKGNHTIAGTDSFVEVNNIGAIVQSNIPVLDSLDIKAFSTDGFPQIWRGSYVSNPPSAPITDIVNSLNNDLMNVKASISKSSYIKISSTTENGGNIAIPVSVSNAAQLFAETTSTQEGNPPHIANKTQTSELFGFFKTTAPTKTNVFLDRYIYTDMKGSLSSDVSPDAAPFSNTYSEILQSSVFNTSNVDYNDYISLTKGNNRGQYRNVKSLIGVDQLGTQQGTARTHLDHITNDEFQLVSPVQLSTDDSIVFVMDKDQAVKTVDIRISRGGRVNSGSGLSSFTPTTTEFSAWDADNESGIDFSNTTVWGKITNNTEYADYAVWMRARNWYAAGGLTSSLGKMLVRSVQYGPNGEKLRFAIDYPSLPEQTNNTSFNNTPSYSTYVYYFGSGSARPTAISAGDTMSVSGPYPDDTTNFPSGASSSGNYYDYTFSAGNFAPVLIGDVLSIIDGSGISNSNSGQFRVANKSGLTVRVFNPNASITSLGAYETTTVTTIADIVGTPTTYTINTVSDFGGSLHQKYFTIYDKQGSVAVWIDVDNTGTPPPPHGANRAIKIPTIISSDSANVVATEIANVLGFDNAFTTGVIGNQITITNNVNGAFSNASAGTSGFTTASSTGTNDITINGTYFTIYDNNGSVAVWYDLDDQGTAEPFHNAERSIRVSNVSAGDSATTIASATRDAINADPQFNATSLSSTITITNVNQGNTPSASAGTSGFTISNTNGSLPGNENISSPSSINIFPLVSNDVASIVAKVNEGTILELVAVGSDALLIEKATKEEDYTYGGNSTALAYNHNPSVVASRGYITLTDGYGFIKSFSNSNPNFTLKKALILNNVAPSIYTMNTCPNYNTSDLGEMFKLIPTTVKNVHHHLTQKALSQLPIISNLEITNDRKKVQITSKKLGSAGAIEVVGGNANKSKAYLSTESETVIDNSGEHLLAKIPAYPDTFNTGDFVMIQNDAGVKRYSRLISSDKISTIIPSSTTVNYCYEPKLTNFNSSTQFKITDVSSSYGKAAGYIWRWKHNQNGTETLSFVREGDLLMPFGSTLPYTQGNKVLPNGDGNIAGFPIINVSDNNDYFDVVNPYGETISSFTAVGVGNTVQICPTPTIRWNLSHKTKVAISNMIGAAGTVTVYTSSPHSLISGDLIDLTDSLYLTDGSYGPITVIDATTFTFTNATIFTEPASGASCIKVGYTPTKYRVEKLGYKNLIRFSRSSGESPRFLDCGVAVDDYVIINGNTFSANNNGKFRVLAVDDDSFIITNEQATDELSTVNSFNKNNLYPTWVSNTNTVNGYAGSFKYVNIGDWVKKSDDPETYYLQVIAMNNINPALATSITLGGNYQGTSAIAAGVYYDMLNDYNKGIELLSVNDITFYEGDSTLVGDTLSIQNIINTNWFSVNNIGSFEIAEVGTDTNYKPFIRINNSAGSAESNRLMSVDLNGFYITEGFKNKFYSIRKVTHSVLDDASTTRRSLYISPSNRSYKFSNANNTSITHLGKLGYEVSVTTGVDGYLYYTGLLQRVQRIVDGYEPDIENFPGRRAVGGFIETLPPLVKKITVSINVTTNEGINLGDISGNIKSVIINYIEGLGVGVDVILSEIIAKMMTIKGVAAVTFSNPLPSTERITIDNNEKATITPDDISIS